MSKPIQPQDIPNYAIQISLSNKRGSESDGSSQTQPTVATSKKIKRQYVSSEREWDNEKGVITELYGTGMQLKELMQTMEDRHKFRAT